MSVSPLVAMPGGWEWIVVLVVVVLIFGVTKLSSALPELAKGTGQALRIFKSETKGLREDDEKKDGTISPDDAGTTGTSGTATDARAELPPVQSGEASRRTEVPSERQDSSGA